MAHAGLVVGRWDGVGLTFLTGRVESAISLLEFCPSLISIAHLPINDHITSLHIPHSGFFTSRVSRPKSKFTLSLDHVALLIRQVILAPNLVTKYKTHGGVKYHFRGVFNHPIGKDGSRSCRVIHVIALAQRNGVKLETAYPDRKLRI
jgi:hypothetical protein